eukprot:403369206
MIVNENEIDQKLKDQSVVQLIDYIFEIKSHSQKLQASYMIAFRVNFDTKELKNILSNSRIVFESLDIQKMIDFVNILYCLTISTMNIKIIEKMLNHEDLLDCIQQAIARNKQTSLLTLHTLSKLLYSSIHTQFEHQALYLIFLWADLTLFYQSNFTKLHEIYNQFRRDSQIQQKNVLDYFIDDLQQIQLNIPILNEVPLLSANKVDVKQFTLQTRRNEVYKAMSRYNSELKKLIKKHGQYDEQVEKMRNHQIEELKLENDIKNGNIIQEELKNDLLEQSQDVKKMNEIQVIKLGKLDPEIQWYSWIDYEEDLNDTIGIDFLGNTSQQSQIQI